MRDMLVQTRVACSLQAALPAAPEGRSHRANDGAFVGLASIAEVRPRHRAAWCSQALKGSRTLTAAYAHTDAHAVPCRPAAPPRRQHGALETSFPHGRRCAAATTAAAGRLRAARTSC